MGKIVQGILGGFSGKVGNIVGSRWKRTNYIRIVEDGRKDANTKQQVAQRCCFGGTLKFAQSLLYPIVRPIWDVAAKNMNMSGFNLFVKTNIVAFDEKGVVKDFSLLQMSKGNLASVKLTIEPTEDVARSVTISWKDNTGLGEAYANDRLRLLVIKEGEIPVLLKTAIERFVGTGDYSIPFESGDTVHLYAFFEDKKREHFSVDKYQAVVLG